MVGYLRRTALVLAIVITVLWIASIWVNCGVVVLGLQLELFPGTFIASVEHPAVGGNYIDLNSARWPVSCVLVIETEPVYGRTAIVCSAWIPVVLLCFTFFAINLKTRVQQYETTCCSFCGYDRSGLPSGGVCPECGKRARGGRHQSDSLNRHPKKEHRECPDLNKGTTDVGAGANRLQGSLESSDGHTDAIESDRG